MQRRTPAAIAGALAAHLGVTEQAAAQLVEAGKAGFGSEADRSRGLFTRVLPNGGCGSPSALPFPPDTPEQAVAAQFVTLDAELAAVRDACERPEV